MLYTSPNIQYYMSNSVLSFWLGVRGRKKNPDGEQLNVFSMLAIKNEQLGWRIGGKIMGFGGKINDNTDFKH